LSRSLLYLCAFFSNPAKNSCVVKIKYCAKISE
jgi:hypothetical protein